MFTKILVGFTALVLLGIGGFLYWDYHNCPFRNNCGSPGSACNGPSPCCQHNEEISTSAEQLAVMPREVDESTSN